MFTHDSPTDLKGFMGMIVRSNQDAAGCDNHRDILWIIIVNLGFTLPEIKFSSLIKVLKYQVKVDPDMTY